MAKTHGVADAVRPLIEPILANAHLELVDLEYTREGDVQYLRIFIDKPGGVTIDDCQTISRECEVVLDIEEIIQAQYILQVSSPGLDRPLKRKEDYTRFRDRLVKIRTYRAIAGRKTFLGRLKGVTDDPATNTSLVMVHLDDEDVAIPYTLIASARLEVEF